jgi:glycosyltransferase involved in cell wall biosynthesis
VIERNSVPVTLLRVRAQNAAAARNFGIEASTGDWIALLDADDVWYPNHLARAVELLDATEDVAFMSNHDWIDLDGSVLSIPESFRCRLPISRTGLSVEDYYRIQAEGFHFGHSTVLYRRDRVLDLGMFDVTQKRRHDLDLWLRMIARGTWTYDTVKGAGYREATPGSISRNELECDYYELRALIKNLDLVKTPLHREHLSRMARRAMGIAFVDSSREHEARIRLLAWQYLPVLHKLFYTCAFMCPALGRLLLKMKRQIMMRPSRVPPSSVVVHEAT